MDRSEAATTLLRWGLQGRQQLVREATRPDQPLLQSVEAVVATRRFRRPRPRASAAHADVFRLDEERAIDALRRRLAKLAPVLEPEELTAFQERLRPNLMPRAKIAEIRTDLDRFRIRFERRALEQEFEAQIAPAPPAVRALLLFAHDGRLLATHGEASRVDADGVAAFVRRGEPGSTWSLSHPAGFFLGHRSERAGIVAVFAGRPQKEAAATLRTSLESLEQRDSVLNAPHHPPNQTALAAYLRAVGVLLSRRA